MRDDLLDAQAAVDWAVAQIPLLQQDFIEWQRRNPYSVVQSKSVIRIMCNDGRPTENGAD
jgi:hypothetical protein